jgi:hypothetical protein
MPKHATGTRPLLDRRDLAPGGHAHLLGLHVADDPDTPTRGAGLAGVSASGPLDLSAGSTRPDHGDIRLSVCPLNAWAVLAKSTTLSWLAPVTRSAAGMGTGATWFRRSLGILAGAYTLARYQLGKTRLSKTTHRCPLRHFDLSATHKRNQGGSRCLVPVHDVGVR